MFFDLFLIRELKHNKTLIFFTVQMKLPWQYGVHRLHRDGSSFMWHQPYQCCKYTTSMDIKKRTIKSYSLIVSCRITCECSESAREQRIVLHKSDQQQQQLAALLCLWLNSFNSKPGKVHKTNSEIGSKTQCIQNWLDQRLSDFFYVTWWCHYVVFHGYGMI